MGFNLYRFSIERARIEPEPGEFSRAAFEHYRRMLATCNEYGITPIQQRSVKPSARWLGSIARANGF